MIILWGRPALWMRLLVSPIALLLGIAGMNFGWVQWGQDQARWEMARELAQHGVSGHAQITSTYPMTRNEERVIEVGVAYRVGGARFTGIQVIPESLYPGGDTIPITFHPEHPEQFLITGQQVPGRFLFRNVLYGFLIALLAIISGLHAYVRIMSS